MTISTAPAIPIRIFRSSLHFDGPMRTFSSSWSGSGVYKILKSLNHFQRSHQSWSLTVPIFAFDASWGRERW
jgi:hypothetical protein